MLLQGTFNSDEIPFINKLAISFGELLDIYTNFEVWCPEFGMKALLISL
jgi:hypothetical protein